MPRSEPDWVLGINAAAETLGVALVAGAELRAELLLIPPEGGRGRHAERLMGAIEALCRLCDLTPTDLAGLAVVSGPGGFTGVRTALAAAKAIAQSLNCRLIPISTLEALAFQAPHRGLVVAMLDARGSDVFGALYRHEGDRVTEVVAPRLADHQSWFQELANEREPVVFIGEGAVKYDALVAGRWPGGFDRDQHRLRAAAVARLGARRLAEGHGEDPVAVLPTYLRPPSAVAHFEPACPPGGTP